MSETDATPESATEQETTESAESVAEWRAEAEKWKELAAKNEQRAKENTDAVRQLEQLEAKQDADAKSVEQKLTEAQKAAEEAAAKAVAKTSQDVDEWRAEAERWKQLSKQFEQHAKTNVNAAIELEKLQSKVPEVEAKAAETAADAEKRATEAEAMALRYEVAESMGVPKHLTEFLTGSNKKELEEQADALLASIETQPRPEPETDEPSRDQEAAEDEISEVKRRAEEAEARALRYEVAAEKELPHELARFLNATDREGLAKQADVLLEVARKEDKDDVPTRRRLPQERLRSGAAPDYEPERSGDEVASAILRRNRGF